MGSKQGFNDVDVEKAETRKEHSQHGSIEFLEAAALLLLWSVLVINEGAIRFMDSNPNQISDALDANAGPISPLVTLLGGIFEVFFGVLGLCVGFLAFIPRAHSPIATKLVMLMQTILGYYVFIVFVFAVPAIRARDLGEAVLPGLSIGESKFLIVLGILTSFHFCLALQGGQFVFMARLVAAATGENFLMQRTGNQMRSYFWNGNLALAGLWTFITGVLVNTKVGSGRLDVVYQSPPNVGTMPGLTIFVGLLMIVWGIFGIVMGFSRQAPSYYFMGTIVVYLFALLNYGIAQFGTITRPCLKGPSSFGGPVALHNGLSFMVVFIGPYFVRKAAEEIH